MALFQNTNGKLSTVKLTNFKLEKEIQTLIERNLKAVFNCRLIASEFPTGPQHSGRIDTLALSEDDNPVVIEYKKIESSELINQSLYYLSWINDHHGDFLVQAEKALGNKPDVDWSNIRVICIAPGYKKYDLHAVQMMGANIELWQYRLYENGNLYIEEVFRKSTALLNDQMVQSGKNPVMVAAGKKAAVTRATGRYTFEAHFKIAEKITKEMVTDIRDFILNIDETVEETPKKFYIAYKVTQNFVCMEIKKNKVLLFLKMDPKSYKPMPPNARDVSAIGHLGTGDFELTIAKTDDVEEAKKCIMQSYEQVGG